MAIKQISSGGGEFTITTPASASNRTITLPDATTTLVGTDATQTLTNKTLTAPNISQVVFPATQVPSSDPNTLDDYEEGTWTPIISSSSGSITSYTSTGAYVKVGKLVTITGSVTITNNGTGSGAGFISGLPFTINSPYSGSYRESVNSGFLCALYPHSAGTIGSFRYDNVYPWSTNAGFSFSLTYIAQN